MLLKLLKYAVGAFVFLILLVVVINVVASSSVTISTPTQASKQAALDAAFSGAKADTPKAVLEALTKAFTPMPAGWGSFSVPTAIFPKMSVDRQAGERVVSFENGDIVVSLDYADPPSGEGQAEQDTKKVVGVILDMLRDLGEDPREQWTKVLVFAQKSDAGEVYGESSYDFQKEDLVKWVEYDPERDGPAEKWIETRSE